MHFPSHHICELTRRALLPLALVFFVVRQSPGSHVNGGSGATDATQQRKEAKERLRLALARDLLKAAAIEEAVDIMTPVLDSDNAELRQEASKLILSAVSEQTRNASVAEGADHLVGLAWEELGNREKAVEAYRKGMRSSSPNVREQGQKDLERLSAGQSRWYRLNPFNPISGSIWSLGNLIWHALLIVALTTVSLIYIRQQFKRTNFVVVGGSNLEDLTWFTDLLGYYR